MAVILFIMLLTVVLTILLLISERKQNQQSHHKNEGGFSDVRKRVRISKTRQRDDFMEDLWLRTFKTRREYYRDIYLKSDAWQRKRFVVLRRDGWRCVHCGSTATQVHHKKYARRIGKEPIEWLESICKPCHDRIHS